MEELALKLHNIQVFFFNLNIKFKSTNVSSLKPLTAECGTETLKKFCVDCGIRTDFVLLNSQEIQVKIKPKVQVSF